MPHRFKSRAHIVGAVLLGLIVVAGGVSGILTGNMSHRGYRVAGLIAGRAFGAALVFGGLAWLRAVWMATRHPTFDLEDGALRFLVLLAGLCVAAALPLLFLDVAF
ncbi:MAG: hypothetical protein KF691_00990 [Phycisphaeraceae bacterium]|nr:hypothetical protein [Phycisphaeraceae bacterium]